MKYRSYHKEIQNATAQMLDLFSDIVIDRRDQADAVQKTFRVQCVYAAKSRIFKSLENRDQNIRLPIICISMRTFTRDNTRVCGIHDGLLLQDSSSINLLRNTPVPINISYNLEIITKYQEDMDMIISNFIPFFNPDVYVVLPHPMYSTQKLKSQVVWDNSISLSTHEEVDKNTDARITASTSFVLKTWIFPGLDTDDNPGHYIKRINFNPCIAYEDGIGRLSNWYDVPKYDWETGTDYSFDKYIANILCGYILPPNYDELQISAGVSGYWHDISGTCTGLTIGQSLSADPCFLVTDDGGLLVISDLTYITPGMAAIGLEGYWDYYQSTLTGELSGYRQC